MAFFKKYSRVIIIAALFGLILFSLYFGLKQSSNNSSENTNNSTSSSTATNNQETLTVGTKQIEVEVADAQAEIVQGLSGRESLEPDTGMYFVLGERQEVTFWMYQMKFPIDIIWIDSGVIVGIETNAPIPTPDNIATFQSPTPVTNVLEVNAGFAAENNIIVGDKVILLP